MLRRWFEASPGRNGGMDGTNAGLNEAFYPLHSDSNSFAFQAA